MEENYLIALIMAFLFGFVLLKKDKKADDEASTSDARSYRKASGETGVAKYLNQQQGELPQAKVSGVAKYLQEKELLNIEKQESLAISGVEKYLASKTQTPVSGVSKYVAKKEVYAKKMAKENISGVEKYLNSRG